MLTYKQYNILLDLFNEFPDEFKRLSPEVLEKFYNILYARAKPI